MYFFSLRAAYLNKPIIIIIIIIIIITHTHIHTYRTSVGALVVVNVLADGVVSGADLPLVVSVV